MYTLDQQPQLWTYEGDSDEDYALDILSEMSPGEQRAVLSGDDVELLGADWKKFWKGVGKAASGGIASLVKKIKKRRAKKKSSGDSPVVSPTRKAKGFFRKRARRQRGGFRSRRSKKDNNTLLIVGGVSLVGILLMSRKG